MYFPKIRLKIATLKKRLLEIEALDKKRPLTTDEEIEWDEKNNELEYYYELLTMLTFDINFLVNGKDTLKFH
jgi:hypothetical protein